MRAFSEKEMVLLTEHLKKEQSLREIAERENAEIFNLMEQYAEMTYLYQVEELSPEAEAQFEQLNQVMIEEETQRTIRQAQLEEAAQMDEKPRIAGRWAQIRRAYLQSYHPEEWLRMLRTGEAAPHLQQIQQETEARYRAMYQREEERQILGQNLKGLEEIQRSRMIEAQITEVLTADLAH